MTSSPRDQTWAIIGVLPVKECILTQKISLVKALCDKSYLHSNKYLFIQCTDNDGFIDSLRYLLQDFNDDSLHMMQLLLMSFLCYMICDFILFGVHVYYYSPYGGILKKLHYIYPS